jgi:PIN domain nuclease of toxin-antitoxin system
MIEYRYLDEVQRRSYLMDSHILLWVAQAPERLSGNVRELFEDNANVFYFSPINLWEISLKYAKGKLDMGENNPAALRNQLLDNGFAELAVTSKITSTNYQLPMRHSDPFDRLLVWQAIQEDVTLISADTHIADYIQDGLRIVF